jgi:hypothetical protein
MDGVDLYDEVANAILGACVPGAKKQESATDIRGSNLAHRFSSSKTF